MTRTPHIVLALLCFTACSQTLTVTEPRELSLRAVAAAPTKADPELNGSSLGTDNTYVIRASTSTYNTPGSAPATYFEDQLFTYDGTDAKWHADPEPIYWPFSSVQVDFLALALKPAAYTALTTAPGTLAFNEASQGGAAGGVTISGWDTYANQYDVMYAVSNGQSVGSSTAGTIPLTFAHTMAVVGFTAKCSTGLGIFTIKSMQMNGLDYAGTLKVDNTNTELTSTWSSLTSGDKPLSLTATPFTVPGASATGDAIKLTDHLLVIPQASRSVTVTYHVVHSIPDLTVTLPLPRLNWKAGYRYTYNLTFNGTEILVDPVSVTDWNGTPVDVTTLLSN